MTRSGVTGTGWPGLAQVAAGGLGALWRDLNPSAGAPLAPLAGQRAPWLAWLPHLLVVALAVVLGTVAGRAAATDAGVPVGLALTLGIAQGLPLALALYRPMAGFWLSLAAGMLVSEVIRAGSAGSVWAEPSLLVHLGVLALVGLQARPRVLVELWLLTLGAGAILVQRMPGLNASPDLAEMTTLSAIVLVAAGALGGRRETQRRLAEQQRISDTERARRTLLEERTRIARELHDVVAHHMSVIAIQAEAAPYRPPRGGAPEASPPSGRPRPRDCASCDGSSACCEPTGSRRTLAPSPPWNGWGSWSPPWNEPASRSRWR